MIIENILKKFWLGKLKLWQSFWLVGGIGGVIIGKIIIFIEGNIFTKYTQAPIDFSFRAKLLILLWLIYTTVGIWRSAEMYNGSPFWKYSTKIYIGVNCISSIFLLFFINISQI